jgi:nucleotide sugar dehydrogenase
MKRPTVSVIGNGFVGGAVAHGFASENPLVYDIDPSKSNCTFEQALEAEIIFVCLPTPMVRAEGGEANLSILRSFFDKASQSSGGVFVIKSTVPVGTTRRLQGKYPHLDLVHNPEFLTAANANKDFMQADRTVLGGDSPRALAQVQALYSRHFSSIPIITMTSDESELVKYAANCFLATKVAFFNEIRLLADAVGADYNKVTQGVSSDKRIGPSHMKVPGPDWDYGFGIDTLGVEHYQGKRPSSTVFRAIWERNKVLRNNWDWEKSPSAVLSTKQSSD